ncbi:hypothetical protein ACIOEX_02455 [Streptomyces sp. NPDC087850]
MYTRTLTVRTAAAVAVVWTVAVVLVVVVVRPLSYGRWSWWCLPG